MKKLIVVAILAMSISGIAQEKKKRVHAEQPQYTAEQKNELQVKKLTLELDLSAKQQKEISEVVAKQSAKREAMKAQMKAKRLESKKRNADENFALKSQMLDQRIAYKSEMTKILTPQQKEKWEKMSEKRGMKGKRQMKRSKMLQK